jgi:hypothetical protein
MSSSILTASTRATALTPGGIAKSMPKSSDEKQPRKRGYASSALRTLRKRTERRLS